MKQIFDEVVINTKGSGLYDFTDQTYHFVKKNKLSKRFFCINKRGILRETKTLKKELFEDSGQFYWGTAKAFTNDHKLFSSESLPVVIPRYLTQDIDTLEDWKQAEIIYKSLMKKKYD